MKHKQLLFSALALAWAGGFSVSAEIINNYTVDFSEPFDTNAHDFRVSKNWQHIVDKYVDSYGWEFWMSYSYQTKGGVDNSACLLAYQQHAGDNESSRDTYDLLVTPEVSGTISLKVKRYNEKGYIEFYALDDSGKAYVSPALKQVKTSQISATDWTTVTLDVEDLQRIGIRASHVYIDDFTASEANMELEGAMTFVTVVPENTNGVIYHNQNADGDIELKYQVSVKNTGQIPLVAKKTGVTGTKNYSISIIDKNNTPFGAPVYVPYDLAIGETSPEFEVKVVVPNDEIKDWWSYSSATIPMNLRENLQGTIIKRANAGYAAYESKFALCKDGAHSTSNITKEIPFGICTEPTTVALEIYNDGVAPLSVKSIVLPAGFTTTAATGESTVASKGALTLPIVLDATETGLKAGELKITYLDNNGAEKTHSVYLYGTAAPGAQWTAGFDSDTDAVTWPEGSFAESSIQTGYGNQAGQKNISGLSTYDNILYSYTNAEYKDKNNKFITPLLTSSEGAKLYYSVARDKTEAPYNMKVYVSADRKNWGEAVASHNAEDEAFGDDRFHQYSIDLPAGDHYVAFALYGMKLNDIVATAAQKPEAHSLYVINFSQIEKQQSGKEFSPSVEVMAGKAEAANAYKAVYYLGDEALAEIPGEALSSSATYRKKVDFKVSKEVEATITLPGKIVFEFTDGTKFESEPLDITITNEPGFVFNTPGIADTSSLPSSLTTAINFGKTNKPNEVKNFEIFNWGTAPLEVTSVTVPEGFTANIENATVAGKAHQPLDITFSAEVPGTYSGELSIKYLTGEGEQEFKLAVNGVRLDSSKWYATFDNDAALEWPAGSIYQKNVEATNTGTSNDPNYAIYATSNNAASDRMFVSPLLKAKAGDVLSFDAKIYSTSWKEGGVKVYSAPTREALLTPDAEGNYPDRTLLTELCGKDLDADHTLATNYQTFNVTLENAGNYYIGIEPYSRAYIDEIYGLEKVEVAHDWLLEGSNVPTEAMQNNAKEATILIRNVGQDDFADAYTVTAYVGGVATTSEGSVDIPAVHKLSESATSVPVMFRSPKVGTFPVYFEVTAGELKLTTEPVNVTFAEETLSAEVVVGTPDKIDTSNPINLNYKNTEVISLYTPELLNLSAGEKINAITLKGKGLTDFSSTLKVYYSWTDDKTLAKPASTVGYNYENMTQLIDGVYEWPKDESGNMIDLISVNFDEPLVYEEGKSLLLLISSSNSSYAASGKFGLEVSANTSMSWKHQNDDPAYSFTGTWAAAKQPILYLALAIENRTVSGEVTAADGTPAANATVTLISNDGNNVQYTGTTDANGEYTINVIQQGLEYDAEVIGADGKEDFVKGISVADASAVQDFELIDVIQISDEGDHSDAPANAVVYLQKSLNPGFNAVAFPMSLTKEEVEAIFGEDVVVLEFDKVTTDAAAAVVNFNEVVSKEIAAGKPYLIFADKESKEVSFKTKAAMSALKTTTTAATDFLATEKKTLLADKMFVISDDNFVAAPKARAASYIPAYSGYIKAANATSLTFTTDADIETGIEDAIIEQEGEDTIYDLNGLRVKNPEKGIYIINGKAVLVK